MLKISTEDGYLELRRLEIDVRSGQTPDMHLMASVHFAGFSGSNKSFWIDGRSFQLFLHQLREVEIHRRGSVQLHSMSPGDLVLEIEIIDAAGHFAVRGQVGRSVYVSPDHLVTPSVLFYLQPSPTELPHLVHGFEQLGVDERSAGDSISHGE
jgi:hypothetical protein